MKRSPITRRVALKRTGWTTPNSSTRVVSTANSNARSPLAKVSAKRKAEREARRGCVEAVIARDRVCQFPRLVEAYLPVASAEDLRQLGKAPGCFGDLVGHEPAHSRNVDRTDPANVIALCVGHNGYVETLGSLAYRIGVLEHGNGRPIRHHYEEAS